MRYKKTVLFCASTLVFMPNLASGITGVKLMFLVNILHVFLFFVFRKYKSTSLEYPKVIAIPCIFASLGYLISDRLGESKNLPIIIVHIINYFVYPYIIWKLVVDRRDVVYMFKTMSVFFLIAGFYAIIELVMGHNYFNDIAGNLGITEGISGLGDDDAGERFGILKCSSIFPYSSSMGMMCAFMFSLVLLVKTYKINIIERRLGLLFVLMPICVLLSGTRSQLIVLVLCVLPYMFIKDFRKTRQYKYIIISTLVILIFLGPYVVLLINSIIDSNNADLGSSSDMRLNQFEICLYYVLTAPYFGHGRNYIWEYVKPDNPKLYGAESVWFQLMVDYGIIGCATYLFIILGAFYYLYKKNKRLCYIPIAYIVGKTLSFVIGAEIYNMLIFLIVADKISSSFVPKLKLKN